MLFIEANSEIKNSGQITSMYSIPKTWEWTNIAMMVDDVNGFPFTNRSNSNDLCADQYEKCQYSLYFRYHLQLNKIKESWYLHTHSF